MLDVNNAKNIKEMIDKSEKPILVEQITDTISGTKRLKYYYPTEEMKEQHIEEMKKEGYDFDIYSPKKETIFHVPFIKNQKVEVIVGIYYLVIKGLVD